MKVKEISYEKSLVIPTGQYSNARCGAVITYVLEDGETPKHDIAATELDNIISIQKQNIALETMFTDEIAKPQAQPAQYAPQPTTQSAPVTAPQESCPKCGNALVEANKKDGGVYKKCSTNKWNRATRQAEGCDFVDWGNDRPAQPSSGMASVAQMNLIKQKWPNEWRDGMTKAEAYRLISSHPRT